MTKLLLQIGNTRGYSAENIMRRKYLLLGILEIIGRIKLIFYNETIKGVVKMEGNHPNEVTFVISRNIKPGYEKDYDDWLRRYLEIERKAPGYLGTTIIIPGGTNSAVRYIIVRYTDKTSMQEWLNSQQSLKLLDGNRHGNMVYFTRLENCSRSASMENGYRCIHCGVHH